MNTAQGPILIIDKVGYFGSALAKILSENFLVIFVTGAKIDKANENTVVIPFNKKFPRIPQNKYSKIYFFNDASRELRDLSQSFIDKSRQDQSDLIYVVSLYDRDDLTLSRLLSYSKTKVFIYGDLFADEFIPKTYSISNKFIEQARKLGRVEIEGDGLSETFPLHLDDFIKILLEHTKEQVGEKIYLAFSKHPITQISLARTIHKTHPDIHVDFVAFTKRKPPVIPIEGVYIVGKYDIAERLKEIEISHDSKNPSIPVEEVFEKKSHLVKYLTLISFFVVFIVLLPLLTTLFYSGLGLNELKTARDMVNEGDIGASLKHSKNAQSFFTIAQKTKEVLLFEAGIIGQGDSANSLNSQIELGREMSRATSYILEAANLLKKITDGKSDTPKEDFSSATSLMRGGVAIIRKIEADNPEDEFVATELKKLDATLDFVSSLINISPNVLGFDNEKKYLVLFQNNMELMPGGGFIGSYGILNVKDARITTFKIHDVYDADGQLKGHVEPPFPIRRHVPQVNWFLRNSNFNIDFERSAKDAVYFLDLETGEKVDGVIAVDVSFVKKLLKILGEVEVADYGKKVNADNFFILTETEVEKDFFAGSNKKKDFLKSIFEGIQKNMASRKNLPYLSFLDVLGESLSEKHLLLAFNDANIQNNTLANNWSSSLKDFRVEKEGAVNDFFGINEANFGINKVNYYIRRSVSKAVKIEDDGEVASQVTISYKNTSKNNEWPGGTYKNYLRLILPLGASIDSIKINNTNQVIVPAITDFTVYERDGFVAPNGLEMDQYEQDGKTIYGFLVNITQNELKTISISYRLSSKIKLNSKEIVYNLKVFKQPGTDEYPMDFSIFTPDNLRMVKGEGGFQKENDRIVLSQDLKTDKEIVVRFAQK